MEPSNALRIKSINNQPFTFMVDNAEEFLTSLREQAEAAGLEHNNSKTHLIVAVNGIVTFTATCIIVD